jgi:hypothetical protein
MHEKLQLYFLIALQPIHSLDDIVPLLLIVASFLSPLCIQTCQMLILAVYRIELASCISVAIQCIFANVYEVGNIYNFFRII